MSEMTVSVAEIKAHLSEYIEKSKYNNKRIIITKRNKPVAALINMEDYHSIKQENEREGLAGVIGKWKDFDEMDDIMYDIQKKRNEREDVRDVSL